MRGIILKETLQIKLWFKRKFNKMRLTNKQRQLVLGHMTLVSSWQTVSISKHRRKLQELKKTIERTEVQIKTGFFY